MEDLIKMLDNLGLIKYPAKEKFRLLNKIKAIANSGQDEKKAIFNKIIEYRKSKKFILAYILQKVKNETDNGKKLVEALYSAELINPGEYYILTNVKGGIGNGIDKILENNIKSSKSTIGFVLALLPPALILLALLFSHGTVKDVLNNMMQPIVAAGATPPPMPDYLMDNTTYIIYNALFFGIVIGVTGLVIFIKKFYPEKYLSIFPIIQEEYVLDLLKSIKNVSFGGGLNISNTAKALSMGQQNKIKQMILDDIVIATANGKIEISKVLEKYSVNYSVCSNIQIGEESGNINNGLDIAISELEGEYNRDIVLFLKTSMWVGQLGMIGIAMKPMIDIMLLVSVGPLNFQV